MPVPVSILDQRLPRSAELHQAREDGVAVFARSIYLQGLVLMPEPEIPTELRGVIPTRRALQGIAERAGLTLPEMALRFGLSLPGVTGVLTGVETAAQLRDNVRMAARGPLPRDVMEAIARSVPDLSGTIVLSPWLWPNAAR